MVAVTVFVAACGNNSYYNVFLFHLVVVSSWLFDISNGRFSFHLEILRLHLCGLEFFYEGFFVYMFLLVAKWYAGSIEKFCGLSKYPRNVKIAAIIFPWKTKAFPNDSIHFRICLRFFLVIHLFRHLTINKQRFKCNMFFPCLSSHNLSIEQMSRKRKMQKSNSKKN